MSNENTNTIDKSLQDMSASELRQLYTLEGGNPETKTVRRLEERARNDARKQYQRDVQQNKETTSKAVRYWYAFRDTAASVSRASLAFVSSLFVFLVPSVGLVTAMLLLVIAEYKAVEAGFTLIEPVNANTYSFALIGFYLVVLFIREILATNYERTRARQYSLAFLFDRMLYFSGVALLFNLMRRAFAALAGREQPEQWQPRYASETNMLDAADKSVFFLMISIVFFSILGRLGASIESMQLDVAWHEALQIVLTQSDLITFAGFVGIPVVTVAMLIGTHFITHFVYGNFRSFAGDIELENFTNAQDSFSIHSYTEDSQAQLYRTLIARQRAKQNSE